jgi:cobalt/nickel transport system ATP-binding protein
MDDTIFELRNVSYAYGNGIAALHNVSLKIRKNDQVVIMGANGSGKSTLLSILDALIYPTSGEFLAFGQPVTEDAFDSLEGNEFATYFRKKVGFVFQNSDAQLFSPTVFEEIAFGPLQLDMKPPEVKARVEEVMAMIGIEHLRDRAPHTLSGGEKKKVCIASVLATNPDVLLLDEPTAGLDPRTQLWLIELLHELGHAGKTIVTATHDLDAIEHISSRAIVMGEDHRVKVDGWTHKIVNDLELLLSTNLIHRHMHRHGTITHQHLHTHDNDRIHEHEQGKEDHDH